MVSRSFFAATEISDIFAVGEQLGTEPAADVGADHPHRSIGIFNTMPHRISRSRWLPWLPMVSVR